MSTSSSYPNKQRWLCVIAGGVATATVTVTMGPFFFALPLIFGVLIQRRWPKLGRGLACMGAILTSAWVLPYGATMVLAYRKHPYFDFNMIAITSAWALSFVLFIWCDLELVREEVRLRREQRIGNAT